MTAAHQLFLQRHGEDRDEDEKAPAEVGPVALRVEDDHLKEDKNNSKNWQKKSVSDDPRFGNTRPQIPS